VFLSFVEELSRLLVRVYSMGAGMGSMWVGRGLGDWGIAVWMARWGFA